MSSHEKGIFFSSLHCFKSCLNIQKHPIKRVTQKGPLVFSPNIFDFHTLIDSALNGTHSCVMYVRKVIPVDTMNSYDGEL